MRFFRKRKKEHVTFDEILLDASNLPSFNVGRMEGRIELPLSKNGIVTVGAAFILIAVTFLFQLINLQIVQGSQLAEKSENNRLESGLIIAERGVLTDRNGELIAWNEIDTTGQYDFPVRAYTDREGLGQIIGYVSYPQKDAAGFYYQKEYEGKDGIEEAYEEILHGKNGKQLLEVDVHGDIISESVVEPPLRGDALTLSIDAELSEVMYNLIATTTKQNHFRSGAGAIMDVQTGELLALTSFPSFDPEVLSDGDDRALIQAYNNDARYPFLNKVIAGVYTPGSIVKPFVAYAALAENIIDPMKVIVSNGSLVVPNPYDPENPAVFNDWRAHGPMTMRDAIAYSSNVYFFTIGGGVGDQRGLGITKMHEYMKLFGIGSSTGMYIEGEQNGVVPNPEWKKKVFDDEWRLGDTYLTAIGQFGFLTTPIQMLRAYSVLANAGTLVTPHLIFGEQGETRTIPLNKDDLRVVTEGMRQTVIQNGGTARSLERPDVAIAAKSGTAELGASKAQVNSWIAGYFPYEKPKYAFILFMENGPRSNTVGAGSVMGKVFDWIAEHRPEYLEES
jgi:penicillin-binding protein 2